MRKISTLILSLALLAVLAAAGSGHAGQKKVTLSGHPAAHVMPVYIAMEKGWFKEEGLDVDTLIYISGPPQMEAVPSGAWQVGSAGTPATITGVLGFNNTILGFSTWDHPAQMLFARPDSPIVKSGKGHFPKNPEIYGTKENYKGIKILGPRGTLGHLQVMATLAAVGLTEDDVEIIHMEIPAAFQAFKAGEGDATMLWSTFTPLGYKEGWVEISSAEKAGFPVPAIIQATEAIMKSDPETVQKIMNVWFRGMMYYQSHKDEVAKMYLQLCQDEGIAASPDFAKHHIDIHDVPSLEQIETWLATDGHQKVLDKILLFYKNAGSYNEEQRQKVLNAFDLSFLKKAVAKYKAEYMGKD